MDRQSDRPGAGAGTGVLLAVRFLSELALLAVLAVVGWRAGGALLAVVLPLAAAVVWGLLVAPRAGRRLPDPGRLLVEVLLFAAAAAGLTATGSTGTALALALVGVGAALGVRRWAPGS